jgi:NAD(P)H dehydrogenase (quinone)
MNVEILILYYSRHGSTRRLARQIARGIESVSGCQAKLRTVVDIDMDRETINPATTIDPIVTLEDLQQCDGLAFGSPVWLGNMAAPLKHFWDSTSALWLNGALIDKPACTFASSSTLHGGQESCLLSMQLPLLHHGMIVMGIPYSEPSLHLTEKGGSPYGASHVANESYALEKHEQILAQRLGVRLATLSEKLKVN